MPHLKNTKMVEMMDFRIFRRSQKPSGPGYIRKHQKRFKINLKGTSRITFGPIFNKYRPKRGRRPKAAALFWERPKAATIFDEIASKSGPGGTFLTQFYSFLCFREYPGPDGFWDSRKILFPIISTISVHFKSGIRKILKSMISTIFGLFKPGIRKFLKSMILTILGIFRKSRSLTR